MSYEKTKSIYPFSFYNFYIGKFPGLINREAITGHKTINKFYPIKA